MFRLPFSGKNAQMGPAQNSLVPSLCNHGLTSSFATQPKGALLQWLQCLRGSPTHNICMRLASHKWDKPRDKIQWLAITILSLPISGAYSSMEDEWLIMTEEQILWIYWIPVVSLDSPPGLAEMPKDRIHVQHMKSSILLHQNSKNMPTPWSDLTKRFFHTEVPPYAHLALSISQQSQGEEGQPLWNSLESREFYATKIAVYIW